VAVRIVTQSCRIGAASPPVTEIPTAAATVNTADAPAESDGDRDPRPPIPSSLPCPRAFWLPRADEGQ
jgi:hypothetical protein